MAPVTPGQRRWIFLAAMAGLAAFVIWGVLGLPGFGRYPGPYGPAVLKVAEGQTNATGVVSAVNFEYRGIDTIGEEFILFTAVAGMTVLRRLRGERERPPVQEARERALPPDGGAVRAAALALTGPTALVGWWPGDACADQPVWRVPGRDLAGHGAFLVYLGGESWPSAGSAPLTSPSRPRQSAPTASPQPASPRSRWGCRTWTTTCRSAKSPLPTTV